MEQSKSYNRPGGYSTYGAGGEVPGPGVPAPVSAVDLLALILEELRYQNAPERPSVLKGRLEFKGGRALITTASGDTFDVGPARRFPESFPPEPATGDVAGLTHYSFVTPEGRPFLSRTLCDLAGNSTGVRTASSVWLRVTCPQCRDLGTDLSTELLDMSDTALISLGAVPAGTTSWDEVTR